MKAFATLLLAINAAVASAQSYSYSYFYETVTFAPTAAPPAPTPALTFAPTFCFDADNGALDGYGSNCEWYHSAEEFGSSCGWNDDEDFTAGDLCCACGGGSFSTTAAPSPSPTFTFAPTISAMPTPAPTACINSDNGAKNADEKSCYYYYADFAPTGGYYACGTEDDDDFSSTDMCCVCGGGVRTEHPSTSPTSPSCYDLDNEEEVSTRQYYELMVQKGYMYPQLSFSYADMVSYSFSYADVVQRMIEDVVSAESYSYTYMTPVDSWGQGCEAYSWSSPDDWSYYQMTYWTYGPTCGEQDDDDFTAADLCCACGGGLDEAPEPVVLAVSLTVEMDCAYYGSDEQAVFAAAMEATIPGASVEAGDCTQLSRRRNLLTASEASLAFTVTVSGTAALTATANSITSVVNDAVNSGEFTDALEAAADNLGVDDFTAPTVTGTSVNFAPTAVPVPLPTASPVAAPAPAPATPAPTASPVASVVLESGSWRLAPGVGLFGTCIAALATAWI